MDMVRFSMAPPVLPMRKAPGVIPPTVAGPMIPTCGPRARIGQSDNHFIASPFETTSSDQMYP